MERRVFAGRRGIHGASSFITRRGCLVVLLAALATAHVTRRSFAVSQVWQPGTLGFAFGVLAATSIDWRGLLRGTPGRASRVQLAVGPVDGGVVDTHALPAQVYWGRPAKVALVEALAKLGKERAFLMVSSSLRRETEVVDELVASLGGLCVGVWDGMPAHSPREAVVAAANAARAVQADVIVTLGGGSLTDGAKVARVALAENVTEAAGLDHFKYTPGDEKKGNPLRMTALIPQITIPTTLSAGEFSWFAGVTNVAKRAEAGVAPKETYLYPAALPSAIILDPALASHTPPELLLSTGLRSVDHCVEALGSPLGNPYSDTLLQGALKLLVRGLRRAKADSGDLEALLDCQVAIWQTVQGCQSGPKMGASHAIGHILGGAYDVPHGITSCVTLPAVLEWNAAEPEAARRQRLVAQVFEDLEAEAWSQRAWRGRQRNWRGQETTRSAAEHVRSLVHELGLPTTLGEVGVTPEMFEDCARRTMQDRLVDTNPRKISGWEDVKQILALAAS